MSRFIRVDPDTLRRYSGEFRGMAGSYRRLAKEWQAATDDAPSYEGQFGPEVRAIGEEGRARFTRDAESCHALAAYLAEKAEAFEAADLETQEGMARIHTALLDWLQETKHLLPFAALVNFPHDDVDRIMRLGGSFWPPDPDDLRRRPWWEPTAVSLAELWAGLDASIGMPIREFLQSAEETWIGNADMARLIAAYYAARGWWAFSDDKEVVRDLLTPKRQRPGFPADGPITRAIELLSAVDANGDPISVVGADLARLIYARGGVTVSFSDVLTGGGHAGVTPLKGWIWIPESLSILSNQEQEDVVAWIAHELAHVLQRDLSAFPDGGPGAGSWPWGPYGEVSASGLFLSDTSAIVGDFTLYMEVQSNIVDKAIYYDLLEARLQSLPQNDPQIKITTDLMQVLANHLANYTGSAADACGYVLQEHGLHGMYLGEMVREVAFGARIPSGGWQYWLMEQGFSEDAIRQISEIAATGTPNPNAYSGLLAAPAGNIDPAVAALMATGNMPDPVGPLGLPQQE